MPGVSNYAIEDAKMKMTDMLGDRNALYGKAGWATHAAGLEGRIQNIKAIISLGEKLGCDMSSVKSRASELFVPTMPGQQ
jgi:hypothetical protein